MRKKHVKLAARCGAARADGGGDKAAESGIALVAVLWIMVVLAALAASFSTSTRTQVNLARNLVDAAKSEAIADAAVARAAGGLAVPLDQGGLRADGTIYAWRYAGGEARFSVSDEGGKVDIDVASRTLLRNLLAVMEIDRRQSETLADAIVAFRRGAAGSGDEGGGDEQVDVTGGDRGESADSFDNGGTSAFALVEELQQVPGMTGDIYRRVAPVLTIYSGAPDPDENAALPEVREALAASRGQREAPANEPRTEEPSLPPADSPLSVLSQGTLAARSSVGVFTIHSEGRGPTGGIFARDAVIAIEYGGGQPYSIRLWRQGRRWLYARPGEQPR